MLPDAERDLIQDAGWERRPASMGAPYSLDLRERVVAAVEHDGLSRNQAAARFGVAISTALTWVKLFRRTGSLAPGQMGGHKPRKIAGEHRDWLVARCRSADFTLRGVVAELAERDVEVDYRAVWAFVHAEKLSFKKPAARQRAGFEALPRTPTSRGGGRNGGSTRVGLTPRGWSSSMRPGRRPPWLRCEAGRRRGTDFAPRPPSVTGTP
jgi:putative transposase